MRILDHKRFKPTTVWIFMNLPWEEKHYTHTRMDISLFRPSVVSVIGLVPLPLRTDQTLSLVVVRNMERPFDVNSETGVRRLTHLYFNNLDPTILHTFVLSLPLLPTSPIIKISPFSPRKCDKNPLPPLPFT